jgi:hypothetical protein
MNSRCVAQRCLDGWDRRVPTASVAGESVRHKRHKSVQVVPAGTTTLSPCWFRCRNVRTKRTKSGKGTGPAIGDSVVRKICAKSAISAIRGCLSMLVILITGRRKNRDPPPRMLRKKSLLRIESGPQRLKPDLFSISYVRAEARTLQQPEFSAAS